MRVLAFGAFDPLHAGHAHFLHQARTLGNFLLVVVTRDSAIRAQKRREPFQPEGERVAKVAALPWVNKVTLGDAHPHYYELLRRLNFDVVVLGYDQEPSDEVVRQELNKRGKQRVEIARLKPFRPEKYKSSYIRKSEMQSAERKTTI